MLKRNLVTYGLHKNEESYEFSAKAIINARECFGYNIMTEQSKFNFSYHEKFLFFCPLY